MQIGVSITLSRKLANLGIVCAALVVIDHSMVGASSGSSLWWVSQCLSKGLCQIAVPFFFCVSGFLLAGHVNEIGWWRHEVSKRVKTLLVPFGIWSVLGSLCLTICVHQGMAESGWNVLKYIGLYPFSLPTVTPLWFLRSLMLLVIMSPFLFWGVRRFRWLALMFWYGASIVLSVVLKNWPEWNNFCGNFIPLKWGCFWFSLGAFFRDRPMSLQSRTFSLFVLAFGMALVIVSKYLVLQNLSVAPLFQKLSIPFLLAGVWGCFPDLQWGKGVTSLAFPIYLVHMPIIVLSKQVFHMTGLADYCFGMVIGLAGSLMLTEAIRRFTAWSNLLFGGR